MTNSINSLLHEVEKLVIARKGREREAQKRGEKFNVFEILGMQSNETRLHSAIIAELLNPEGNHGLGAEPLRTFVTEVCNDSLADFKCDNAKVFIEYNIGRVEADYDAGGRIDIVIKDGDGKAIIIENKIYAGDQPKQISRYNKFANDTFGKSNYQLFYLTLDGHSASEFSVQVSEDEDKLEEGHDYYALSYREDIIKWLNQCRSLAIDKPAVREVLGQYIQTLNKLTVNDMTKSEQEQLYKALANNIDATSEIFSLGTVDFTFYLIEEYILPKMKEWAKSKEGLSISVDNKSSKPSYWGIRFSEEHWKRKIRFEFETTPFKNLIIGVVGPKDIDSPENSLPGLMLHSEKWHYGYNFMPKFRNLTPNTFAQIKNGDVANYFVEEVDKLYQIIKENIDEYPM